MYPILARSYPPAMPSPEERREALKLVYEQARGCAKCPEFVATRTQVVFGAGNANADLMFVGEAPGANEDRMGRPFVGQAGKLLDQLLVEVGLERADVFISNVLLCRPPGNRDPHPVEIDNCQEYLLRELELIEPRVVCTLGNFATKLLRGDNAGITRVHGREEVWSSAPARCGSTRSTTRRPRSTRRACSRSCARTSPASRSCSRCRCPTSPRRSSRSWCRSRPRCGRSRSSRSRSS